MVVLDGFMDASTVPPDGDVNDAPEAATLSSIWTVGTLSCFTDSSLSKLDTLRARRALRGFGRPLRWDVMMCVLLSVSATWMFTCDVLVTRRGNKIVSDSWASDDVWDT